jgi:hypothetical protein
MGNVIISGKCHDDIAKNKAALFRAFRAKESRKTIGKLARVDPQRSEDGK